MFRELYKQANDEIKGDRKILDKAFEMAQMPQKKSSPILKYSFVGTCVAAVLVMGAIFANSDIFMQKTIDPPTEEKMNTEGVAADNSEAETEAKIKSTATENAQLQPNEIETGKVTHESGQNPPEQSGDSDENLEKNYSGASKNEKDAEDTSVQDDLTKDAPVENALTEGGSVEEDLAEDNFSDNEMGAGTGGMSTWSMRRGGEEPTETESDFYDNGEIMGQSDGEDGTDEASDSYLQQINTVPEKASESELMTFSYMSESEMYVDAEGTVREGFKNTTPVKIENAGDALKRAEAECTVEYTDTEVFYDMPESMWKVYFYSDDPSNKDQIVYMDSLGITKLIVYIE